MRIRFDGALDLRKCGIFIYMFKSWLGAHVEALFHPLASRQIKPDSIGDAFKNLAPGCAGQMGDLVLGNTYQIL